MSAEAEEGCPDWMMLICCCYCCCFKAETRAEFAERTVAKLEKTIDDLEGRFHFNLVFFQSSGYQWHLQSVFIQIFIIPSPSYLI